MNNINKICVYHSEIFQVSHIQEVAVHMTSTSDDLPHEKFWERVIFLGPTWSNTQIHNNPQPEKSPNMIP